MIAVTVVGFFRHVRKIQRVNNENINKDGQNIYLMKLIFLVPSNAQITKEIINYEISWSK